MRLAWGDLGRSADVIRPADQRWDDTRSGQKVLALLLQVHPILTDCTDHTDRKPRMSSTLERTTFKTSRLLEFCTRKELTIQTGQQVETWPLVCLKELVDNGLDAAEEAGTPPQISVSVTDNAVVVQDNGPGIPIRTVKALLDFSIRVSSREAYVSPTRGAQGNALKTVIAMPFVLDGIVGLVEIAAQGINHAITFKVDPIRQAPVIEHSRAASPVKKGTRVTVHWPDSACSILAEAADRFLQIAEDYTWLNPHLDLTVEWMGKRRHSRPSVTAWEKWIPSYPTSPHWYDQSRFERLIGAYVNHSRDRTVREFIAEFRGLSATAKQAVVLDKLGLARAPLASLCADGFDKPKIAALLAAMQEVSKPVKPKQLGVIGKSHLARLMAQYGADMDSFDYSRTFASTDDGLPCVVEFAFAWCPEAEERQLITGVNWSPAIGNPFRQLGSYGLSLDTILSQQRADRDDPVVLVLHVACPHVEYIDRGKSAIVIAGEEQKESHREAAE
jgi:DNA topoisomerase VI subunit B